MNEDKPSLEPFEEVQIKNSKRSKLGQFKSLITSRFLLPKSDNEKLRRKLDEVKSKIPVPVIWLFGKTQSGKTSIIRALTGADRAEIGNGFQSCTKFSSKYFFPDESDKLIEFLDTKGIGETTYDPSDDIGAFIEIAHMLVVVVKSSDFALDSMISSLSKIIRSKKNIPVLVVQSHLHELYEIDRKDHIYPHIYKDLDDSRIPNEIKRTLVSQRELFKTISKNFVVVDLTLPEDGFSETDYGADILFDEICNLLPFSYRMIFQQIKEVNTDFRKLFNNQSYGHILFYSITSGLVAAVPIPFAVLPLLSGIQVKMLHSISSIYGNPLGYKIFREIAATIGLGFLVRQGGRELLKFLPGIGSVVSAIYAASTTFALGMTFCYYFSLPKHQREHPVLKEYYKEQVLNAKEYFKRFFENYKKQ